MDGLVALGRLFGGGGGCLEGSLERGRAGGLCSLLYVLFVVCFVYHHHLCYNSFSFCSTVEILIVISQ